MSALGKVIKADVLLHVLKVAAAGLGLFAAARGLRAALPGGKSNHKSNG